MLAKLVFDLPEFDTGQYEGSEFVMKDGNASLTIHISEIPDVIINFARVRWHQFTAVYNCEPEMVRDSYFKLVEVFASPRLAAFMKNDRASTKPYKNLHHYRIFLDETGCHEVFAETISAKRFALPENKEP